MEVVFLYILRLCCICLSVSFTRDWQFPWTVCTCPPHPAANAPGRCSQHMCPSTVWFTPFRAGDPTAQLPNGQPAAGHDTVSQPAVCCQPHVGWPGSVSIATIPQPPFCGESSCQGLLQSHWVSSSTATAVWPKRRPHGCTSNPGSTGLFFRTVRYSQWHLPVCEGGTEESRHLPGHLCSGGF